MYYSPAEVQAILIKYSALQSSQEDAFFQYGDSILKKFKRRGVLSELHQDEDQER